MEVADCRCHLGDIKGDCMLIKRSIFYYPIVEIALSYFHHQVGLLLPDMQSIGWQNIGMLAEEMDLTLIDEKV
jgi:hypothetical protein